MLEDLAKKLVEIKAVKFGEFDFNIR